VVETGSRGRHRPLTRFLRFNRGKTRSNMPSAQEPSPTIKSLVDRVMGGEGVTDILLEDPGIHKLRLTREMEDILEILYVSGLMPSAYISPFDTRRSRFSHITQFERDLPAILTALADRENRTRILSACARITVTDVVAGVKTAQAVLRKRENRVAVCAVMAVLAGLLFLFARLVGRLDVPVLALGIALLMASIILDAANYVAKIHRDAEENMAHHLDRLRYRNEASPDAVADMWRRHMGDLARVQGQPPPDHGGHIPDPWRLTLRNMAERIIGHRLGSGITAETGKAFVLILALFLIRLVTHWMGYPLVGNWLSLLVYGAYIVHGLHALSVQTCFMARLMHTGVLKAAGISVKGVVARSENVFAMLGWYTIVGGYLKVHFLIALLRQYALE